MAASHDALCACGCARECHRAVMEWGQRVRAACRHCLCDRFTETAAPPAEAPALASYDAYACPKCGARYGQLFDDHACGPLMPVTVKIVRREVANVD